MKIGSAVTVEQDNTVGLRAFEDEGIVLKELGRDGQESVGEREGIGLLGGMARSAKAGDRKLVDR